MVPFFVEISLKTGDYLFYSPGVLVLLVTEQYEFFELFVVANATQGRTRFAAQTDTWVTTPQLQVARFVTRWSVARHPALPSASEVLATPATRFLVRFPWSTLDKKRN